MANTAKPQLIQQFENLLWANSPNNWILESTYFQETLFVSMTVITDQEEQHQKIRRSFNINVISSRIKDLWGLAIDCIDEMKNSIEKR